VGVTKIFLPTHRQTTFYSTLSRMIYLSQPIEGILLLTSQLFSGRVMYYYQLISGLTEFYLAFSCYLQLRFFYQQRLWADGILIPNLHKALLVVRKLTIDGRQIKNEKKYNINNYCNCRILFL
jgi:hypothetical protein